MKTITFTDAELAALKIEFFPRMTTASVAGFNDDAARALYKIDPALLPYTIRLAIEAAQQATGGLYHNEKRPAGGIGPHCGAS